MFSVWLGRVHRVRPERTSGDPKRLLRGGGAVRL